MLNLKNKIALITGSAQGLGKGIALILAKAGADIIINDLNKNEKTETLEYEIRQMGRSSIIIDADVSDEQEVEKMYAEIDKQYGKIHILINNAGTTGAKDIFDTDLYEWRQIIKNNLDSCFLCSKAAASRMKLQNFGRIVNISSVVGLQGALLGHVHYAASKSGILGFTKTLARTLGPHHITVNAIAPGIIDTELLRKTHGEEGVRRLAANVPLGLGKPEDVGNAVAFLCSDEAQYITGATIDVNGGMYMH